MKIAFDEQIFTRQKIGGISRYFSALMAGLSAAPQLDVTVLPAWKWSINPDSVQAGYGNLWPATLDRLPTPNGMRPLLRMANYPTASGCLRQADLIHETYYVGSHRRRTRATPRAVTIHDMIPELMPQLFPGGNPHLEKERLVRDAAVVFCVSEATKVDLLAIYGSISAPIFITPLGADPAFQPSARKPSYLDDRYVLYVGRRDEYKDFTTLLDAFVSLNNRDAEIRLFAVGGGELSDDELAEISRRGLENRVKQMDVPEVDLPGVYAAASCLALPSLYEGFGLPTVEAMASGCPVIAADVAIHREIGSDAAAYFPPGDADALSATIGQVLAVESLSAGMRSRGFVRAKSYTWQACAAATANGYHQAWNSLI